MIRPALIACLIACLALVGCRHDNPSTGNDTEAALDPATRAAPQRSPADALAGVSMDDVQPETMSKADLDSLGGMQDRCVFRLTATAWPSFVYSGARANGILKLNETLITLPATGADAYAANGVRVILRPLKPTDRDNRQREADLIIRLPHVAQELGFKGYLECQGKSAHA